MSILNFSIFFRILVISRYPVYHGIWFFFVVLMPNFLIRWVRVGAISHTLPLHPPKDLGYLTSITRVMVAVVIPSITRVVATVVKGQYFG